MSRRVAFTNATIDAALAATGDAALWTRDVPSSYTSTTFPYRMDSAGEIGSGTLLITPAKESDAGRGAPFHDVYSPALDGWCEIGISLKVSNEDRKPRNSILAGSKARHYYGLLLAAQEGKLLPAIHFWQNAAGQWYRLAFDAGKVLREYSPNLTAGWHEHLSGDFPNLDAEARVGELQRVLGRDLEIMPKGNGGAVAINPLPRPSGGEIKVYLNLKISHEQIGAQWVPVDGPRLPRTYAELLDWCGVESEMIG